MRDIGDFDPGFRPPYLRNLPQIFPLSRATKDEKLRVFKRIEFMWNFPLDYTENVYAPTGVSDVYLHHATGISAHDTREENRPVVTMGCVGFLKHVGKGKFSPEISLGRIVAAYWPIVRMNISYNVAEALEDLK